MRYQTTVFTTAVAVLSVGVVATQGQALPAFSTTPRVVTAPAATPQAALRSIRVGRHARFDRIVFRFTRSTPGYRVRYVPSVSSDGAGDPVPLLGSRFLSIVLQPTVNGTTANAPAVITPRFTVLRQVKRSGDFEGVASFGAGLSRQNGFRVFTLTGPRRVVIDVAR